MRQSFFDYCKQYHKDALLREWDTAHNLPLTPQTVTYGCHTSAWWRCENGHEWKAAVYTRIAGARCPYCTGRKVLVGFNDLATQHPELARQWDYRKNAPLVPADISAGSHRSVWWRCEKGHSWRASIHSRASGCGCPICAGRQILVGENDLATVDPELAHKVVRSIRTKISAKAYYQVYLAAMSNDPGRLDDIYRFLRIGFAVGGKVTECLREESVMQIFELSRQVSNERHFFREFLRFTRIEPGIYVAHMEPKGNVVALVAGHFADRMPSEDWMIIDDGRGLGVIHPKNEPFYVTEFRAEEMERLRQTEQQEDLYTKMWKEFFYTIAVEKRENPGCQRNMFPLRYRKHVTEFL